MSNDFERGYVPPEIAEQMMDEVSSPLTSDGNLTAKSSGRGFYDQKPPETQVAEKLIVAGDKEEALELIEKNPDSLIVYFNPSDYSVLVAKDSGKKITPSSQYGGHSRSLYEVWEPGLGPVGFSTTEDIEKYIN